MKRPSSLTPPPSSRPRLPRPGLPKAPASPISPSNRQQPDQRRLPPPGTTARNGSLPLRPRRLMHLLPQAPDGPAPSPSAASRKTSRAPTGVPPAQPAHPTAGSSPQPSAARSTPRSNSGRRRMSSSFSSRIISKIGRAAGPPTQITTLAPSSSPKRPGPALRRSSGNSGRSSRITLTRVCSSRRANFTSYTRRTQRLGIASLT